MFIPSKTPINGEDTKDILSVDYAQTGLGAQTLTDHIDGRTFRKYSVAVDYTAGGTLAGKIYVSNEDVASGSVSQWIDKTLAFAKVATITASGDYVFSAFYRWVKFEWTLTSTGNGLSYQIWKGWDAANIDAGDIAASVAHIADDTIHFTEGAIVHQNVSGAGNKTHEEIDTHLDDDTIHFTESSLLQDKWAVQTTTATETAMSSTLAMVANGLYQLTARVTAKQTTTLDIVTWEVSVSATQSGLISGSKNFTRTSENDSGGASTPANWDIDFDVNSNSIRILVTGEASTTINWDAIINWTENID